MNLTIESNTIRTWKQIKARSLVVLSGFAIVAGLAAGGVGSLAIARHDTATAVRSVPAPQFATAADAEYAAVSQVSVAPVVAPMFGTAADPEHAARGLVEIPEVTRPQPVQSMFATEADAEYAARALVTDALR